MGLENYIHRQVVSSGLKETWTFFADPSNLLKITEPSWDLAQNDPKLDSIYEGAVSGINMKIFPGLRMNWISKFEEVTEGKTFTDFQLKGLFKYWRHRHSFRAVDGGTEILDEIEYELPFGILGRLIGLPIARWKMKSMFAFRAHRIKELLG